MNRHLRKAISIWSKGEHIDLALADTLMNLGYDLPALEARFMP